MLKDMMVVIVCGVEGLVIHDLTNVSNLKAIFLIKREDIKLRQMFERSFSQFLK
jgi:hypothetical protein